MCSIAGAQTRDKVEKMLDIQKHRAPDGEGIVGDKKFTVGMGRSAIIDLKSHGLCPYTEDDYLIAFDGRIYNYLELRKKLEKKGWEFKTNSDTEVLLKAWREWDVKMFDKLNGMFAFAIYDGNRVILARDIVGEKPLYFSREPFRFASEAKSLDFRCNEFPPASYGIYNFDAFTIRRYWNLTLKKLYPNDIEEQLEELLGDAIKIRLKSDVPYGLYYSGGVDSSLINTFHDFEHKFTYEDKDYAEEFKEIYPKIAWHLDYPIKSFSAFGLWKLAEMASKKVKVIISGEGADELFGGYVRYIPAQFEYEALRFFPSYKSVFDKAKNVNESGVEEFRGNLREILRMSDRMASAFGLETRCPFLDKRVIEFAFSLPHNLKIKGFDTKIVLKKILKKRNPEWKDSEKHGLFCSVNKWIGSKDKFKKEDYIRFQKKIWKELRA